MCTALCGTAAHRLPRKFDIHGAKGRSQTEPAQSIGLRHGAAVRLMNPSRRRMARTIPASAKRS